MIKRPSKEDIALLVEEASEMFEETGCVPDADGKKVRAEKIVPRAKRYILETIDNPKASYDATIWHSPGYTLVLSWLSQKWLKVLPAPTVLKDADLHLPKDQRAPSILDAHIAPNDPAQFCKPLQERCVEGLKFEIIGHSGHEYPDAPHALWLLPARC